MKIKKLNMLILLIIFVHLVVQLEELTLIVPHAHLMELMYFALHVVILNESLQQNSKKYNI